MDSGDLRAWRARRRLTQREAAHLLGYHHRGIQEAEKREGEISQRLAARVARIEQEERQDAESA